MANGRNSDATADSGLTPSTAEPATIAYLLGSLRFGGAENHLTNLLERLDRSRYRPVLYLTRKEGPFLERVERAGVAVRPSGIRSVFTWQGARAMRRLSQEMRRENVRIVHSYLYGSNLIGVALAGLDPEVAHLIALRRHLLPHPEFFRPLFKWVQGPRTRFVSVSRGADGVLDSWGVDQRWRYRVPNGVALPERWTSRETRDLRRELGVPEEALLITMVANFHPIKGHPELIRALALLPKPTSPPTQKGRATRAMSSSPEAWLCLVGDGRLLDHCRSLASDLGVAGRVVFAGHRGDIPRILQASDIFVLNSKSEGMSNALLEAIAAGLPCIATGVGGNPEVVADGVNGFLVPPNDAPALARRLAVLIQDPELRRVMGARSDEKARREFSFESMVAKTEAIYDEILAWQEARRTSR